MQSNHPCGLCALTQAAVQPSHHSHPMPQTHASHPRHVPCDPPTHPGPSDTCRSSSTCHHPRRHSDLTGPSSQHLHCPGLSLPCLYVTVPAASGLPSRPSLSRLWAPSACVWPPPRIVPVPHALLHAPRHVPTCPVPSTLCPPLVPAAPCPPCMCLTRTLVPRLPTVT